MNDDEMLKEGALIAVAFDGPNAWPKQSVTWNTRA